VKAFVYALLGWRPTSDQATAGVLGHVNGYYGCVEAQGRGTLHVHFLIWVTGSLDPDDLKQRLVDDPEFKTRLFTYLDDAITNSIPDDLNADTPDECLASHPSTVRTNLDADDVQRQKRIRRLATRCQTHRHTATCFKYCKDEKPEDRECRFDLDPSNTVAQSSFDIETGDINLRKTDGMINNFNHTILDSIACNMDIKFIGSGASAKAIIHYITDYISKPQMQSHASYVVLERASAMLNKFKASDDVSVICAKKLLQRCAYEMIACQELSGQQVASHLMDYEDHFTSHDYNQLYWPTFEVYLEKQRPSPECYRNTFQSRFSPSSPDQHNITEDLNGTPSNSEEDDINVQITNEGDVLPVSNQVMDYTMRGNNLRSFSL
ncbi:hypothetical protein FPV67DRAFT_1360480, partial [Lyophyllum atratum]